MYCIVIPFSQSFDDIWFTYKIPFELENSLKVWMIVNIPFSNKNILWLVSSTFAETSLDKNKIKSVLSLYNSDIFLNKYQILLLNWISNNYFCLAHASLGLFFPTNLKSKLQKNKFSFSLKLPDFSYNYNNPKILNNSQQEVFDEIKIWNKKKYFLYWVTWSWKTEIYINLIKHYLDLWKQSLLLVPEIILTNQIFDRITKVFWNDVLVINSTVSEAKKTLYWDMIYQNKAKIIVWTRSSIFYPYNNLWLIIIDEEHDNSYISDNTPRYDAIDVCEKICEFQNDLKLVLASWTPKINHMYKWLKWDYKVLNLFWEYK